MLPSAASTARRTRLLRRTGLRSAGAGPATACPVTASLKAARGVADDHAASAGEEPAVAQGLDDRQGLGMTALRHGRDRGFRVGIAVGGEFRQRESSKGPAATTRSPGESDEQEADPQAIAQCHHAPKLVMVVVIRTARDRERRMGRSRIDHRL